MNTQDGVDFKSVIIEELDILRRNELQQKNVFKARAYNKVIQNLRTYPGPIKTSDDLTMVEGIGEKILAKIEEILLTGHLQKALDLKNDHVLNAKEELIKVYGIGPTKAAELVDKYKITGIYDLINMVYLNPDILNEKQKIGLKYVHDINTRIPRKEMEKHEARIEKMVSKADARFTMEVVGSYRREAADSGDIDVLLTMPSDVSAADSGAAFSRLIQLMQTSQRGGAPYLIESLAQGDKKYMGICRLTSRSKARRLDLLFLPAEEYAYGVLYFTGSGAFNIGMRKHALGKGYTLNEHRMKPTKEGVPDVPVMATEKDIFDFLGIRFVPPHERERVNDVVPNE